MVDSWTLPSACHFRFTCVWCIYISQYQFRDTEFLTFEAITLVPIQEKMLLPELLTQDEVRFWQCLRCSVVYLLHVQWTLGNFQYQTSGVGTPSSYTVFTVPVVLITDRLVERLSQPVPWGSGCRAQKAGQDWCPAVANKANGTHRIIYGQSAAWPKHWYRASGPAHGHGDLGILYVPAPEMIYCNQDACLQLQ